jgi:hypothetical protein
MGWLKQFLGVAALEEAGIKIGTQVSTVEKLKVRVKELEDDQLKKCFEAGQE